MNRRPLLLQRGAVMSREPDIERPGPLTPETLAELEGLICQRLGGRLLEFRL